MNPPLLFLFLARHGKSVANQPWLFLGHLDSPLCAFGRKQAEALAAHLAEIRFDAIYTSPLMRAYETAEIIAKQQQARPIVDKRLIEQDFGAWEGLTLDEVKQQLPEDMNLWQADASRFGPTGGETLLKVLARTKEFHKEVLRQTTGKALVVAHGSVLNTMLCFLLETPLKWQWAYPFEYGNVSEIALYERQASLLRFNALVYRN